VTRRRRSARSAVIDTCCVIDLLASGNFEAILQSTGHTWHIPVAVQAEVQFVRQHDPARPGSFRNVPVDLSPHLNSGLLTACQPLDLQEQTLFVQYAAQFRSDGDAMCLAIAETRGCPMATDDRKAIRVARQAGLTVLSCPELVKMWAVATKADHGVVVQVLTDIQTLAQFRPNASMPEAAWWQRRLGSP
jgi:predicted nucleic acid-binding protein